MTNKTPAKEDRPPIDETRMAYEAHTLAQMLYGQLAMTQHWTTTAYPPGAHGPFAAQSHLFQQPQPPQMAYGPPVPYHGWGWGR